LDYRKSVSDEYTAIEWRDGREAGGSKFFGIRGKVYIDCLGGYVARVAVRSFFRSFVRSWR